MHYSLRTLLKYKVAFLQGHPSFISEIACIFIGGSRLYSQQNSQQSNYDGIIVANSKHDIYSLISDRRQRQRLLNLVGIEYEERSDLYIPSPSSPLYHEFDAVRISGYDGEHTQRTITFLSLEYFSRDKVSLNILSGTDRRVYADSSGSSVKLCQATTLDGSVILHDQLLYMSNEEAFVTFACRMLVHHHASATGSFPSVNSFAKSSRFSSPYTKWLDWKLARLRPENSVVALNLSPRGERKVFLFGSAVQTRTNAVFSDPVPFRSLPAEAKVHEHQFSHNSSSYTVKTKPPGNIFNIFVKTASCFFPRVTVPQIASSGELLYPFFNGSTESDDTKLVEKLLYVELSSLSLEKNAPGHRYYIQRFFHDRLLNDRRMQEYYGQGMTLAGKAVPLDKLLSLRCCINGKVDIISPDSAQMISCPHIFGLGDAHGGNVMINQSNAKGGTSDVLFIDYELLYNDLFYETLYQRLFPGKVNLGLKYRVNVDNNTIIAILDVKLRYLVKPVSDELWSLGVNLEDYLPLLSTALFLCATVSRGFVNNEQAFGARSWEEFACGLEELGFKPRAGLQIQ
ncbi:hypothetical protein F5Y07DRAFT_405501 [Xylaria sp. FL0933]|nr:hypothetical protein F5Y07DRAFT_405501 [Xylaria sp. FL0933]